MSAVLAGLVGDHIGESGAPRMHQQEAADQNIILDYHLYDLAGHRQDNLSLANVLQEAKQAGYVGLNITHPYKQIVMELLDELSPSAARAFELFTGMPADTGRMSRRFLST